MAGLSTLLRAAALGVAALAVQTGDARAQPVAPPEAAILVLNQDRLLTQTDFGQRIQAELEAASQALAAENRRIEAQLTEEELDLTERRPDMSPADFRALANEFDSRVVAIRAAQDAKGRDLQAQSEAAQQRFFEETFPVLLEIIESRGASVLLDSRTVLLSAGSVDITDAAIAAINEALGDGGEAPLIALPGVAPAEQ
jgi:Skp family chaperone for outer membrane proteins